MRAQVVAILAVLGMGGTSAATWWLTPVDAAEGSTPEVAAGPDTVDAPTSPEEDRSRFVAGQTLELHGRLGHAQLAADPQSTYVLATVSGRDDAGGASSPLDLSIVIDTSGSMRGSRLVNAIEAARGMVGRMRDNDRVSVITYDSQAHLLVPMTSVDPFSRQQVQRALAGIRPGGSTCISCGLDLAMRQGRASPDRVSRILLLSDGEATAGVRDVPGFHAIAARCRSMGTTVSTIGVDIDYNDRTMGALALFSNGQHYFVQDPSGLPQVFDREFESLSRTLANGVELVVELADGVQLEQVFDRAVRQEGNRLVASLGTVGPGEEKTLLVAVRLPAGASGTERPVADVRLRYEDLVARQPGQCEGTLAARTVGSPEQASELDPFVSARIARAETASGLREANELAAAGQFEAARRRLSVAEGRVQAQQARAMAGAEGEEAAELADDFGAQTRALGGARGGFSDPGLAQPAATPSGRVARERARRTERSNTELANPFSF